MPDEQRYREVERRLWKSVRLEPVERRIRVAGVGVRVQLVEDGPPVVFLHGGPNSGSTWAPLLPHLTKFRCYVVDRPGTGLSDDFVLLDDLHGFARRFVSQVLGRAGSLRGFPPELTIPNDVLRSVRAPTLFLWGEDDPFGAAAVASRVVELMPHASLRMIAAAGHLPWLDDPDTIGRATAEFLSATD